MKKLTKLLFVATMFFCLNLFVSCKKENFSAPFADVMFNGSSERTDVSGAYDMDEDAFYLRFTGERDEQLQDFKILIQNLLPTDFEYNFGQTDEFSQVEIALFIGHDGDTLCDIYNLDGSVSTNVLEIMSFNRGNCQVTGSYDLTFRSERDAGCENPRFPEIIRVVVERFEATLEGC